VSKSAVAHLTAHLIPPIRHSGEGRNLILGLSLVRGHFENGNAEEWIPAFAGMTMRGRKNSARAQRALSPQRHDASRINPVYLRSA
jgi:hypothetical protein